MAEFKPFAEAVRKRFAEMAGEGQLFQVKAQRGELWEHYLAAFPAGSNEVFQTQREHDCACCRGFIRRTGGVVAIQNGAMSTIWDLNGLEEPFQTVADAMAKKVRELPIRDIFLTKEGTHGTDMTPAQLANGSMVRFHHFFTPIPRQFVCRELIDKKRGDAKTTYQVLTRGLTELRAGALAAVAGMIKSNELYRGAEYEQGVLEFQALQERYLAAAEDNTRELLAWTMISSRAARLRNTAIGTLLQDLSGGMDLARAKGKYEREVVAPERFKRSSAPITARGIDAALAKIRELDLEDALERRHAKWSDVPVTSVLFVDNAVRGQMKGGLKDLLMQEVKPGKFDPKAAEEIGIEAFLRDVLPRTTALSLYLDNGLLPNFASLTAPAYGDVKPLFAWDNNFAWVYEGGNADSSIRAKVKAAGGRVENVALRVSLAWHKRDDYDLHCETPDGTHIFFHNKCGILDIDMNVGGESVEPVENMRWIMMPRDGAYTFWVHNFTHRESVRAGHTVEIECDGRLETLHYDRDIPSKGRADAVTVVIKNGRVAEIKPAKGMVGGAMGREAWGLKTLDFVPVDSVILSPNHWNGAKGNKHWFFILKGCLNPEPARGFFNEMLRPDLTEHRKVFEVLADKTKCQPSPEQLSGLGFSSTQRNKVTVIAAGPKFNRPYTIVF